MKKILLPTSGDIFVSIPIKIVETHDMYCRLGVAALGETVEFPNQFYEGDIVDMLWNLTSKNLEVTL